MITPKFSSVSVVNEKESGLCELGLKILKCLHEEGKKVYICLHLKIWKRHTKIKFHETYRRDNTPIQGMATKMCPITPLGVSIKAWWGISLLRYDDWSTSEYSLPSPD